MFSTDRQKSIRLRWYCFILGPSVLLIFYQVSLMTFSLGKKSIEFKTIVNTLAEGNHGREITNERIERRYPDNSKPDVDSKSNLISSNLDPSIFDIEFIEEKESDVDANMGIEVSVNPDKKITSEDNNDDADVEANNINEDPGNRWDHGNIETDKSAAQKAGLSEMKNRTFALNEEPGLMLSIWEHEDSDERMRDDEQNERTENDFGHEKPEIDVVTELNEAEHIVHEEKRRGEIASDMKRVDQTDSEQQLFDNNDTVDTLFKRSNNSHIVSKQSNNNTIENVSSKQKVRHIGYVVQESQSKRSQNSGGIPRQESSNIVEEFGPEVDHSTYKLETEGKQIQRVTLDEVEVIEEIDGSETEGIEEQEAVTMFDNVNGNTEIEDNELDSIIEDQDDPEGNEESGDDESSSESRLQKEEESVLHTKFKEQLLPQEENNRIALKSLDYIVPGGEYIRWLKDDIYRKNVAFFTRFRSRLQLQNLQLDLVDFYGKSRPDLQPVYLSIGLGGAKTKGKKRKHLNSLQFGNPNRGRHVFLVGSLHGCQWATPLGMLHTVFALFGRGVFTRPILDAVRFHFIMIANPDGYDYSRRRSPSTAKHWCKNRRVLGASHGVDLERNWGSPGISWGFGKSGKGASKRPNYQGPTAFSEPETKSIRDYISHFSTGRGRSALVHVRCCSGTITPPKFYNTFMNTTTRVDGGTPNARPDGVSVDVVANFLAKTVTPTPLKYRAVKRVDSIGRSDTGKMIDWAYSEVGIEHSYEIDFRASGLATHMNFDLINEKPFFEMASAIERATVIIAQLLLSIEVTGLTQEYPYTKGIQEGSKQGLQQNSTTLPRKSTKLKSVRGSRKKRK